MTARDRDSFQTTLSSAPGQWDKDIAERVFALLNDPRNAWVGLSPLGMLWKVPRFTQSPLYKSVYDKAKTVGIPAWRGTTPHRGPADPGDFGYGPYYTTSKSRAQAYGRDPQKQLLKFKNPLVVDVEQAYDLADWYKTIHGTHNQRLMGSRQLTQDVRLLGHDAIISVSPKRGRGDRTELEFATFGFKPTE